MKRGRREWPSMGELVAALFAIMAVFGLLSFGVILIAGLIDPQRANAALSTALLTFTGSSAAGFAATWRFIVQSVPATDSTVSGTRDEEPPTEDSPMVPGDRWRR